MLASHDLPGVIARALIEIQHDLFDIGGELCIPGHSVVTDKQVEWLEQCLDKLNADLDPLKEFILPGGSAAAAVCHLARTVCRRAERRVVSLARKEDLNAVCLNYLNRLSDLLFVMARTLNHASGRKDILWQRERNS